MLAVSPVAPPTQVNVWVSKNVAPGKNVRLNINTRNLPVVRIAAYPVDGETWLSRMHHPSDVPIASGHVFKTWTVTVSQPGQQTNPTDAYFSRQVNLPITRPGVYRLEVSAGGKEAAAWVDVTNLAIVAKRSTDQGLIWVTDHKSGRVVPGAALHFYDPTGHQEESATTGSDGARLVKLEPASKIVVVRRGIDIASVWIGPPSYDGNLNAFWQTDRPIYRPGQDVCFKAILRLTHGQGYDAMKGAAVNVQLLDPKGNPVDQADFKANDNGSLAGKFNIPSEGMLGAYTLELSSGDLRARRSISVAEYRKPEFKVDVTPAANYYLAGQTVVFKVHAGYYFGAPLPQAAVRAVVRSTDMPYSSPGSDEDEGWFSGGDGNLYPRDTYGSQPVQAEEDAVTDNNGDAEIKFTSKADFPDASYSIDLTVTDPTHRLVEGSGAVPVYSSLIRLSAVPELDAVAIGGLVTLQLRSVDIEGHPIATKVRIRVYHDVWSEEKKRTVRVVLSDSHYSIPTSGRARATAPLLADGPLTIEVTAQDSTGRKAVCLATVWGEELTYRPPKEEVEPQVNVRLDRKVYGPGDPVKAFISSNVSPRPMLIVEEGREIWSYKVVDSSKVAYQFRTDKAMSPDCFLTAVEWVDHRQVGDSASVPLPDLDRRLSVTVQPDKKEYRPGDTATYRITTKDRHGSAVPAEVSLAVVDEAIYAISPDNTADPFGQYWGFRPNQVLTTVSAPEEVSGGAYQRSGQASPTVRTRFEDTAYWNAFVQTDANGQGTVSFEVPGNLTTWRATARTITPNTLVGAGRSSVVATRPLTLRLALPRAMTIGDHLQIQGTVNNRAREAATVHVRLNGPQTDYALEGGAERTVTVPANGQAVVSWTVTANDDSKSGQAVFQAEAIAETGGTDMSDALRSSVPVMPRGYRSIAAVGGTMDGPKNVVLDLPSDVDAAQVKLTARLFVGGAPALQEKAREVLATPRYGSPAAADQLLVAGATRWSSANEDVREDLALLSRTSTGVGWGWWENLPADADITADVLHALSVAKSGGRQVPPSLIEQGLMGARQQYIATQLWERRAELAASMADWTQDANKLVQEVLENGKALSPYARLRLIEALQHISYEAPRKQIDTILPLVSRGPVESYLPVGDGIGWTASDIKTTAELLSVLVQLSRERDLQDQLVAWLISPDRDYECDDDKAATVVALSGYLFERGEWQPEGFQTTQGGLQPPRATSLGGCSISIANHKYDLIPSHVEPAASIVVPYAPVKPGSNSIHIEGGRLMYSITAEFYRPASSESHRGVRVARKYEVRNPAGVWTELDRAVVTGEPVRVTLSIWGDDISDAIRVDEPIPAGFEFVDSEVGSDVREEVRDAKLVHYLANAGRPVVIRYFLRAESTGTIVASPPSGQYLRRPAAIGHGIGEPVTVVDGGKQ